jgi:hypothetical protein
VTGKNEGKARKEMRVALLMAAIIATAGTLFYFSNLTPAANRRATKPTLPNPPASKAATLPLSLPFFFEPNRGQADPEVKFLSRGAGYGLYLSANEAVLKLRRSSAKSSHHQASSSVIRMQLDGGDTSARVMGVSPLPGKSSYFIGNDASKWLRDIPQFARVQYEAVYPGVNLIYYGNQGQLEYDFRVAPGADPGPIALRFAGASTRLESGNMILSTPDGDVVFHAPRVYQPAQPQ